MSPFRGQSSGKPLLASIKYMSTPESKHNGARDFISRLRWWWSPSMLGWTNRHPKDGHPKEWIIVGLFYPPKLVMRDLFD